MKELASLESSLLELLSKVNPATCPLIIGGGYGLYLRRTIIQRAKVRTLLDRWPEARSTNDLDLFLRPELMCNSSKLSILKTALDELGYKAVEGAEHYQFQKADPSGIIERGIKIDLLTGPSSSFEGSGLKVDNRRVRPRPSIGLHAHPTDEAVTLEQQLDQVDLSPKSEDNQPALIVFLPHPFTYLLMKLFAFRDQEGDAAKENGSNHALDLYSIVAMMTELHWNQSKELARKVAKTPVAREAQQIVEELFRSQTTRGMIVLRSNPYCTDDLQLDEFIQLLAELFAPK